jgi:hypothetical protein
MQQIKELQKEIEVYKQTIVNIESLIVWDQIHYTKNFILIEALKMIEKELLYLEKSLNKLIAKNN